jgi:hypothetical protein
MAITIKGIRLESVEVKRSEEAMPSMEASYSLMSSVDKVLATQNVGGYSGLKLTPSPDTIKALNTFLASYRQDITTVLGLDAGE